MLHLNWDKILETVIGGSFTIVIGGGVTLSMYRLQERSRQVKEVQDWYYNHYIENGVEPLLAWTSRFHHDVVGAKWLRGISGTYFTTDVTPIPEEAVYRTISLTGIVCLSTLPARLTYLRHVERHLPADLQRKGRRSGQFANALHAQLLLLRALLVDERLGRRMEVHEFHHRPSISKYLKHIGNEVENISQDTYDALDSISDLVSDELDILQCRTSELKMQLECLTPLTPRVEEADPDLVAAYKGELEEISDRLAAISSFHRASSAPFARRIEDRQPEIDKVARIEKKRCSSL